MPIDQFWRKALAKIAGALRFYELLLIHGLVFIWNKKPDESDNDQAAVHSVLQHGDAVGFKFLACFEWECIIGNNIADHFGRCKGKCADACSAKLR